MLSSAQEVNADEFEDKEWTFVIEGVCISYNLVNLVKSTSPVLCDTIISLLITSRIVILPDANWPIPLSPDVKTRTDDVTVVVSIVQENKGHRKVLASADINLKRFASPTPTQTDLTLKLKPLSVKVVEATLKLSLSCVFVREGKAT